MPTRSYCLPCLATAVHVEKIATQSCLALCSLLLPILLWIFLYFKSFRRAAHIICPKALRQDGVSLQSPGIYIKKYLLVSVNKSLSIFTAEGNKRGSYKVPSPSTFATEIYVRSLNSPLAYAYILCPSTNALSS